MINYIIDGNNLIGKNTFLMRLQKKDKQSSREKLVLMLDRFFYNRKNSVTLHLDGFPGERINSSKVKIVYSQNLTADERIKKQIENSASRKNTFVVTSDNNLAEFARVCSCKVISSEEFLSMIQKADKMDDEEPRMKEISNQDIIDLFTKKKSD